MRCDFKGCKKIPYAEVFPSRKRGWSYLCKKHYIQEFKKYGDEYGWYELTRFEKIKTFLTPKWWYWWY